MPGRQNELTAAMLLFILPVLLNACAGHETMQTKVVNEYLLTSTGIREVGRECHHSQPAGVMGCHHQEPICHLLCGRR